MHRILKTYLDKSLLKGCTLDGCDKSESNITYLELIDHLKATCNQVDVTCPIEKCKKGFKKSQWKQHMFNECEHVELSCPTCMIKIKKQDYKDHNCLQALLLEN